MSLDEKELIMTVRVIQNLVEEFLAPSESKALPENILHKFGQITDKLHCSQRIMLAKKIPAVIEDQTHSSQKTDL